MVAREIANLEDAGSTPATVFSLLFEATTTTTLKAKGSEGGKVLTIHLSTRSLVEAQVCIYTAVAEGPRRMA